MAATTINLPLYRVLTDLNVPEERAREAAEASVPDLSGLVTKADLQAMLAGFEERMYTRSEADKERADARLTTFEDRTTARFTTVEDRINAQSKSLEDRLGRLIAEKTDAQTKWIAAIAASTIIILLSSSAYLWPPTRYAAPLPPVPAVGTPQH